MEAFVTLTTNAAYSKGAVTLGQSLRNVGTTRRLVVLVSCGVPPSARDDLASVWDELIEVDVMNTPNPENLDLFGRPELGVTLTKLYAWKLTMYQKCVFLDADTLVLQNIDDLFTRPEPSAAPDVGWPDCFNSGVLVLVPSLKTYDELIRLLAQKGTFDGGDQGLLNSYWSDWSTLGARHRLPFTDNQTVSPVYTYVAACKQYGHRARVLHFLGTLKPWHHAYSSEHRQLYLNADSGPDQRGSVEQLKKWWSVYTQWADKTDQPLSSAGQHSSVSTLEVAASSPSSTSTPAPASSRMAMQQSSSRAAAALTPAPTWDEQRDRDSRQRWEQGNPDYYGQENFANVQAHLQKMLSSPPS
eukprot:scpid81710/ scgid9770/ Glycogenin-1